jgi:ankyrin repeat protein
MWAVAQKHSDVAKVLMEHNADMRARSKAGFTPLLFAARVGDIDSARVLLDAGVDLNEPIVVGPERPSADRYGAEAPPTEAQKPANAPATVTPLLMASASGHEQLAIFPAGKRR